MIRIFSKNLWNHRKSKFEPGWLALEGEKISQLQFGKPEGKDAKQKFQDVEDFFIGPSGIDLHLHSRDFEESHKETFESLELAASKGGVSAGACMANTLPRLDSVERIETFLKRSSKLKILLRPFAAVTQNLEGKQRTDWKKLLQLPVAGLSDDGKPILDEKIFVEAAKACAQAKKILSLHEEDTRFSKASLLHLSETSMRIGIEGSESAAESSMLVRDLRLTQKDDLPLHFGHLSSKESVEALKIARKQKRRFSAELTPHHALLSVDDSEDLPWHQLSCFKVCPPIRSKEDRAALWKAVKEGVIDCFASDHAPHSPLEKEAPYAEALHGMISLEYHFPLYNEFRLQSGLDWSTFFSCYSRRPAQILGLERTHGSLELGMQANFIIFDPQKRQTLKWNLSHSKNTPFEGITIRGIMVEHWSKGRRIY